MNPSKRAAYNRKHDAAVKAGKFAETPAKAKGAEDKPATGEKLAFATKLIPDTQVGQPYAVSVVTLGGVQPIDIVAHGLPDGWSLASNGSGVGKISGKATTAGRFDIAFTATDSSHPERQTDDVMMTVSVVPE